MTPKSQENWIPGFCLTARSKLIKTEIFINVDKKPI